jgi:hypothetical protein
MIVLLYLIFIALIVICSIQCYEIGEQYGSIACDNKRRHILTALQILYDIEVDKYEGEDIYYKIEWVIIKLEEVLDQSKDFNMFEYEINKIKNRL